MSAVVDVDQERGGGIGASQAAQALGLSPWGAPIELWEELTGRRRREESAGQAARWGQILEPVVRGVYVERHRISVEVPQRSIFHGAKPWLRATPDGIAVESRGQETHPLHLVQVKCPGLRQAPHWGTEEWRVVPMHYHVQAAVEMAVTGLDRVDFAVLLGGQEYFEVPVHRDEELEADILDGLSAFWRCVETDTAPPVDGSEAYGRYLSTLIDAKSERSLTAEPDLDNAIARWREVRAILAQAKAEEGVIKNRLMAAAAAAGAKRIKSAHGTVPIVTSSNTRRDWEALARKYAAQVRADADIDIEEHTTRSPHAYPRAPAAWSKELADG